MADEKAARSRIPGTPTRTNKKYTLKLLSFSVVRLSLSGFVGGLAAYIAWVVVDWILCGICGTGDGQAMASLGDFLQQSAAGDGGASGADLLKTGAAGAAGTGVTGLTYQATDDTLGVRIDPKPDE